MSPCAKRLGIGFGGHPSPCHHPKDLALGALFPMATHPTIVLRGMQRDWSLTYMHEKIFRVHLTLVARRIIGWHEFGRNKIIF
jgi:hypothetical protein